MEIKLFLALLASVLAIGLFVPYFIDIFRRKTQPQMYSWLIWAILQTVGAAAMIKGGAGYGSLGLAAGGLMCLSIFLLSFKYGSKNVKRFDIYCLIGALAAVVIYLFVNNPLYSIIIVALIDFTGYLPTFRKVFSEPYSETLATFALSAVADLLGIFALQQYSFTTVFYVAILFLVNSALSIFILLRRQVIKQPIRV